MSDIDPRHKHPLHEASHRVGVKTPPEADDGKVRTGKRPGEKRIFDEASHKLGYWKPEAPRTRTTSRRPFASASKRCRTTSGT